MSYPKITISRVRENVNLTKDKGVKIVCTRKKYRNKTMKYMS